MLWLKQAKRLYEEAMDGLMRINIYGKKIGPVGRQSLFIKSPQPAGIHHWSILNEI